MFEILVEYWVEFVLGLIISLIGYLTKKIEKYKRLMLATQNGVRLLLKIKIIEKYNEFREKNCITIYDREVLEEMYVEYQKLGGNGIIENLAEEIDKIPLLKECGGE